jgi:hypothetical protein
MRTNVNSPKAISANGTLGVGSTAAAGGDVLNPLGGGGGAGTLQSAKIKFPAINFPANSANTVGFTTTEWDDGGFVTTSGGVKIFQVPAAGTYHICIGLTWTCNSAANAYLSMYVNANQNCVVRFAAALDGYVTACWVTQLSALDGVSFLLTNDNLVDQVEVIGGGVSDINRDFATITQFR